MNQACIDLLNSDKSITISCKAWLFIYKKVLLDDRFQSFAAQPLDYYPFYDETYSCWFELPLEVNLRKKKFLKYCEYWFDACCRSNKIVVRKGLRFSGGGLGVVSKRKTTLGDFVDEVYGVLEFVTEEMFHDLEKLNCSTLYKTWENDLCLMYGTISLCNNSALLPDKLWPTLIDRDYVTNEELVLKDVKFLNINVQKTRKQIKHNVTQMHLNKKMELKTVEENEQIFVNYSSENYVDLTL